MSFEKLLRATVALFPHLVGQRPLLAAQAPDWRRFFAVPGESAPQPSKRIDALYSASLMHLPPQLTGVLDARPAQCGAGYHITLALRRCRHR
jgi:hypothetical protein